MYADVWRNKAQTNLQYFIKKSLDWTASGEIFLHWS